MSRSERRQRAPINWPFVIEMSIVVTVVFVIIGAIVAILLH